MGTLSVAKRKKIIGGFVAIIMFTVGISMILPFIFMISAAFKTSADVFTNPLQLIPSNPTTKNYDFLLSYKLFYTWYYNTFKVVVITIIFRLALVSLAAYAFSKLQFRGKDILFLLFLSTMMIVPDTTIVPRYLIFQKLGILDSHLVLILPKSFDVFFIFLLRQFFNSIPKDYSEAAIIDGASHIQILTRIVLPLAKPAIVTTILFSFLWIWNDFVDPYIFINTNKLQLISVGIKSFQTERGADYPLQLAAASLAVIPPILIFTLTQKYFIEGLSSSGVKG